MKRFSVEEMENVFEIARIFESIYKLDLLDVDDYDSKDIFGFALELAIRFEEEYPETEDYYTDIDAFVTKEIIKRFGK